MIVLGETCLLAAFIGSGFAAVACLLGHYRQSPRLIRSGVAASLAAAATLSAVLTILAWALITKDFRFQYVVSYSNQLLSWQYALSALWVGQAGSLLVWASLLCGCAWAYRLTTRHGESPLREVAFGILMGCLCFMLAILVYAADPMSANLAELREGAGLSPLLQHPVMLVHPPVVFAGYAAWSVPFALAMAALATGRLDDAWVRAARPWAVLAWTVLGAGILLGAYWAYQELGWGGYWAWDPVENGSLMPWLTGTALVHGLMAWRTRGVWKKSTLALAIITFGLCNYATFLTRSGIFQSVHAFSQSPIGWMFLGLMGVLAAAGAVLIAARRRALQPQQAVPVLSARESLVSISGLLLTLMSLVVAVGTLVEPLSRTLWGRTMAVGPEFYNYVMMPVVLGLLVMAAVAPLLRWGAPPSPEQGKLLAAAAAVTAMVVLAAAAAGLRQLMALSVAGCVGLALACLLGALLLDARRRPAGRLWPNLWRAWISNRRAYGGYLVHLGFFCVAIGVAGSSLGAARREAVLYQGDQLDWNGWRIRYDRLAHSELPDKSVAEAVLLASREDGATVELRPAQQLHLLQNEWTTEVAIHSSWRGDLYVILHTAERDGAATLTFIENPLMRWMWLGGFVCTAGALLAAWPRGRSASRSHRRTNEPLGAAEPRPARAA